MKPKYSLPCSELDESGSCPDILVLETKSNTNITVPSTPVISSRYVFRLISFFAFYNDSWLSGVSSSPSCIYEEIKVWILTLCLPSLFTCSFVLKSIFLSTLFVITLIYILWLRQDTNFGPNQSTWYEVLYNLTVKFLLGAGTRNIHGKNFLNLISVDLLSECDFLYKQEISLGAGSDL
jgi:hypothetical protein